MITDDDFDRISIEVTAERLVVLTDAGTQQVTLPLSPTDTAEMLSMLIAGQGAPPRLQPLMTRQSRWRDR